MKSRNKENWFDVQKLDENLYGIGEFGHYEEVLSFLLVGSEQALLIDTGLGLYSMKELVETITPLPVVVVNTHSHFDHVGSNAEFEFISSLDHADNRQYAEEGVSAEYLTKWRTDKMFWGTPPTPMPDPYEILPYPHMTYFEDGAVIDVAPFRLEVLHTPGHSEDSICLFERERGWLFAGDLLYDGPIYIEQNGGLTKYRKSLDRVAALGNIKRIFGSHNAYEFSLKHFGMVREAVAQIKTVELEEAVVVDGKLRLE